jgi:hypothetical protein
MITRHEARITAFTALTHLKWHHHVQFLITEGEMAGHTVSFRIRCRVFRWKLHQAVTIEIGFKERWHSGITYHDLHGRIIEPDTIDGSYTDMVTR